MLRLNKLKFIFVLIALLAFGTTAVTAQEINNDSAMGAYYVHYNTSTRSNFDATLASLDGALMNDYAGFLDGVVSVTMPTANAEALANSASVSFMEPMPVYELMAEYIPYGLGIVQARQVWDSNGDDVVDGFAGSGYTVCVIDTGIISGHKEFTGSTISGMSLITGESWTTDGNGHGTHVSGTVGAGLQGIGLPGVAPESDIHHVKIFNNAGLWVVGQSDLVAAVQDCVGFGSDIISMSLGDSSAGAFSATEDAAFQAAYNSNVLSVAAAANDGLTTGTVDALSYPASYDSVMSVAAVDNTSTHATFSNENAQVEIAAPGVEVMSTYPTPNDGGIPVCQVSDSSAGTYECAPMQLAIPGTTTGTLVAGGLCGPTDISQAWSGNIVLCERGTHTFRLKVDSTEGAGAIGTIIYNNIPGNINGTLGSGTSNFPAVALSQTDGQFLLANALNTTVTITDDPTGAAVPGIGGYAPNSGTSMATPHVAGAAAVIWAACPEITNDQLRAHMTQFAFNPNGRGSSARDISYGWGIVKISDAISGLFDGVDTYTADNADGGTPMNAECPSDPLAVELSGVETGGTLNLWVPVMLVTMMLGTVALLRRRNA